MQQRTLSLTSSRLSSVFVSGSQAVHTAMREDDGLCRARAGDGWAMIAEACRDMLWMHCSGAQAVGARSAALPLKARRVWRRYETMMFWTAASS